MQVAAPCEAVLRGDVAPQASTEVARTATRHGRKGVRVVAQTHRQRGAKRQHPLPVRHGRQPVVDPGRSTRWGCGATPDGDRVVYRVEHPVWRVFPSTRPTCSSTGTSASCTASPGRSSTPSSQSMSPSPRARTSPSIRARADRCRAQVPSPFGALQRLRARSAAQLHPPNGNGGARRFFRAATPHAAPELVTSHAADVERVSAGAAREPSVFHNELRLSTITYDEAGRPKDGRADPSRKPPRCVADPVTLSTSRRTRRYPRG
mgnify:CR=1 FL=1